MTEMMHLKYGPLCENANLDSDSFHTFVKR